VPFSFYPYGLTIDGLSDEDQIRWLMDKAYEWDGDLFVGKFLLGCMIGLLLKLSRERRENECA